MLSKVNEEATIHGKNKTDKTTQQKKQHSLLGLFFQSKTFTITQHKQQKLW